MMKEMHPAQEIHARGEGLVEIFVLARSKPVSKVPFDINTFAGAEHGLVVDIPPAVRNVPKAAEPHLAIVVALEREEGRAADGKGNLLHCRPTDRAPRLVFEGNAQSGAVARFAGREAELLDAITEFAICRILGEPELANLSLREAHVLALARPPRVLGHDVLGVVGSEHSSLLDFGQKLALGASTNFEFEPDREFPNACVERHNNLSMSCAGMREIRLHQLLFTLHTQIYLCQVCVPCSKIMKF